MPITVKLLLIVLPLPLVVRSGRIAQREERYYQRLGLSSAQAKRRTLAIVGLSASAVAVGASWRDVIYSCLFTP